MKGAVFVIAFLLAAVAASAEYPSPDTYFIFKGANCSSNGTINFDVVHSGVSLKISNLSVSIESEKLAKQKLLGSWNRAGWILENYTEADFISTSKLNFDSNANIYTAGRYVITLSWPSSSIYYDNIKFAVDCPGIACTNDNNCVGQQSCTKNQCEWLSCAPDQYAIGHTCFKRCEDNNVCTDDYFLEGQCVHAPQTGCCTSNNDCNAYESCKENKCVKPIFANKTNNIFIRFWNWLRGN